MYGFVEVFVLSLIIAIGVIWVAIQLYERVGTLDLTAGEIEQTRTMLLTLVIITLTLLSV